MSRPPAITGLGALGALGHDLAAHRLALSAGEPALRPLAEMEGGPPGHSDLHGGWIEPRDLLRDRKWSPSSMAAIRVAGEAIAAAGWSPASLADAAVFFGTSRGPLAGWIDPWPGRRGFDLLAATNSLPAEPAAAVSAVHGIGGPWQVVSTGCCAGLDALAMADMWIRSGRLDRAVVVAVDLPLVAPVLDAYARTGLLAGPEKDGMRPAEAAAALCLECGGRDDAPRLLGCHAAADPTALVGSGRDAAPLADLISRARDLHGTPTCFIPHASGTADNLRLESRAIAPVLGLKTSLLRYKPHTGHGIGASGLLETVLCLGGALPPGTDPPDPSIIFKLASALGGRHSLACLSR